MRIPITRYGLPQVLFVPLIIILIAVLVFLLWPAGRPWSMVAGVAVAVGVLAFFRDPERQLPEGENLLLAPADGKITDIMEVDQCEYLEGRALRIGIFLSVFDVHLNRSPCAGRAGYLKAHPGKCFNAMRWHAASEQNQAHSLGIDCPDHPAGRVLVKQITGAIARRIVCECALGEELSAGQRFGMIKLGSRTELFLPIDSKAQVLVEVGQTVRAGSSILVSYDHD